jgi:hypothetical protein
MKYPKVTEEQMAEIVKAREQLKGA